MVQTVPNGAAFMVDGVSYITAQTFLWPQGSKHTVTFPFSLDISGNSLPFQQSSDGQERFAFGGWNTNLGPLAGGTSTASVTADPGITSVTASLTETYQVTVNVPTGNACASNANFTYGSGVVLFNGACLPATTSFYMGLASIPLTAVPYPGWVFYGWQINGSMVVQSISSFQLKGAATITPLFSIAKRVHFMTNPPGLMVLVDRTQSTTPLLPSQNGATCTPAYTQQGPVPPAGFPALCAGDFDFLPNSTHSIGANTPQQDQVGNYWVFEGYTNGTGQNGNYVADTATNTATTLTATFVAGVKVTLITSQPGLSLTVDGRSNWQGYTFVWGQGETHTISAPASQVDAQGRTWTFVGWSNGGTATQTLTVPSNTTSLPLTATFQLLPQVTINSVPQGMQFSVDGSPCTTPCVVSRASGYALQVAAPGSISSSAVSRMDFGGWSDGTSAATRTITFNGATQTFSASYHSSWALVTTVSPVGSANVTFSPPSPDGFFADATQVTVTVAPNTGFKFLKWAGDFSGNFTTGYLTMSGPHAITAYTMAVPAIAPAGIMSAAGATPDGTMAPGSIISIYGQNLAPGLQIGSTNPLPQSLGEITVTIGNFILPLLFVSPTQINAQLPSELADGDYTLTVHQTGQPDVPGKLTVSRDAPAMFTQTNAQNQPLVLAVHQDGSLVTFDSPAIRGETISIYGTGFGPYATTIVDGYFVPATPPANVYDPVVLNVGAITKTPDFAGAAPGTVGLTLVQLKITDDLPAGTSVNLSVMVNAKQSTTLVLPLQ